MIYGATGVTAGLIASFAALAIGYPPVLGGLLVALGIGQIAARLPSKAAA